MSLKITLSAIEARVIGCLIEKQITTPDQYPLSINALTNACNQKSNRDPVLALADSEVQQVVDALVRKHVMLERSGFGSRVAKYQHCFCNTDHSGLKFTPQELAIVCELLVRGPQTPGELRGRAARMAPFADSSEVESALEALAARPDGALVVRLAREPGRRESRYAQLFTGAYVEGAVAAPAGAAPVPGAAANDAHIAAAPGTRAAEPSPSAADPSADTVRMTALPVPVPDDVRLDRLEREISELRSAFEELRELLLARP